MTRRLGELDHGRSRVCLVCRELASGDILKDAATCMMALAQKLALAGGKVTILWIPVGHPKPEEIEKTVSHYKDAYSIDVVMHNRADETTIYQSDAPMHPALGLYTYLKNNDYAVAYIPLEGGLAYYTLLGRETGVYKNGPRINIIACAPVEWSFEADRSFFWGTDQLKVNFMEKYCAQEADKLICTSGALHDWMKAKGWKLCPDCETLPALTPDEWNEQPDFNKLTPTKGASEIVLMASPRFRDGMTLFCDVLDRLDALLTGDLTVSIPGGFYRILGEHTGGMFVRRGRRWKFQLRFLKNLNQRQSLVYAREVGAVVAIPNFESANGYGVAECIRLGVPFAATAVGGNIEQARFASVAGCLAKPNPKELAALLAERLRRPDPPMAKKFEEQKFQAWLKALAKTKKTGIARRRKPAGNSLPLVSVIMTHYDRPQYFLQALESVKDQDYQNFEVIVVDDGSSQPASHAMLESLKGEFKRRKWKIIKTENRFVSAARNTGVRASRGKFIIFVDDDNALLPGAISTFVSAITHSNSDLCTAIPRNFYGRHVPGSNRFNYAGWLPLGASPDVCFFENVIGDTCSIYRRTVFEKVGYFLEKFGNTAEDYEFFVRIMLRNLKTRVIPEPLFWYRVSTQGRYRSSHYYNNHLPVLDAFTKSKFKGLESFYKLALGHNIPGHVKNSYKINLTYSPSDRQFLELSELADPNSREAVSLLAKIAADELRPDTAMGLLASLGVKDLENGLDAILKAVGPSSASAMMRIPVFTSTKALGTSDLLAIQVSSELPDDTHPKSYVEQTGQLFVESVNGSLSIAVLPAGVPAHTVSVVSRISAPDAANDGLEFLLLLVPMYENPMVAVQAAGESRSDASSGWVAAGSSGIPVELVAHFSTPSLTPSNLVLALRSRTGETDSVIGGFGPISIKMALEEKVGRPRLGAPPRGPRGRDWSNIERTSATLVTEYTTDLPMLLFPRDVGEGIFLRPSTHGPVVAALHRSFPAFAQRLLAQVEIAHEESSPFEFAVALTVPGADLHWRASGPKNAVAFSGWVRVEDRFKLHDIRISLMELMSEPLTISLAIRLPHGSSASPANAFWRKMKFFWEE